MLKKEPLLLLTNDNILINSHISELNNLFLSESFDNSLILKEKDLKLFMLILKLTDNNTLSIIDFIVKSANKKYKSKDISNKEDFRFFIIKQIILLFKYLSINKRGNIENTKELYFNLYKLILKFHNSFNITTINDMIEIIRYNIILSLNDLMNNYYIFNYSIDFLVDFYKTIINKKKNDEKEIKVLNISLIKLLETIYKNLLKSEKNLKFFQRYENIEDLSIFNIIIFYKKIETEFENIEGNEDSQNLNDIITKIILLIFRFNYSKLINEIILNDIKEAFFELKKGNDIKIKNIINFLSSKIHFVNNIYLTESEYLKNDIYFPNKYFIFNNTPQSGIDYNP